MTPEEIAAIIEDHKYPALHAGDTGINVITLQIWLKMLGFYQGAITGLLDAATAQAVDGFRAQQLGAGMTLQAPTGTVLDRDTWEAMDNLLQQRLPPDPTTLEKQPFPRRSSYDSEAKYHKALYEGLRAFGFPVKPADEPLRLPVGINESGVGILHGVPPGSYTLELGGAGSPGRGSAEIRLENADGAPLSGQIRLVRDGAEQSATVASGHALINGLEPGDYQVVMERVDEADQIVTNTGSVEIRLFDADHRPVDGTATLVGETGDVASLQQAVRLFQALSRRITSGLEPGDKSGLGKNILTGGFVETAHLNHELIWGNFERTWGRFHGAPWMGVMFHPLDHIEEGRDPEDSNWGDRETVATLYDWGDAYLHDSQDEADLKERLRRPAAIRYIGWPLGGRMDSRTDFSQVGTNVSLHLPRKSEKVIAGIATGQTYGEVDYDSPDYSAIHLEAQLVAFVSLSEGFVVLCPDGELVGRLQSSAPMTPEMSLLEDRYARNKSINARVKSKQAHLNLGSEWRIIKNKLIIIAKRNEELKINEYHQGVQRKLLDAFREFEAAVRELNAVENPAAKDKHRLKALLWALKQTSERQSAQKYGYLKKSPQLKNSVSMFPKETWKCNKFVADAYAYGAGQGLSTTEGEKGFPVRESDTGIWPPQANELAKEDHNLRSLTNAKDVGDEDLRPGDIVAYPSGRRDESGHASIYIGKGLVVSAKGDEDDSDPDVDVGATIETMEFEQNEHRGNAFVRQWTGSGK